MMELTRSEMLDLRGEGFWTGAACGLSLVASFAMIVEPTPFTKLALIAYASTLISCVTAFDTGGGGGGR